MSARRRGGVVHLCGLQKFGYRRARLSTTVGSGEQRVLARDGLGPDDPLDRIGAGTEPTIIQEALKRLVATPGIADRLGTVLTYRRCGSVPFLKTV